MPYLYLNWVTLAPCCGFKMLWNKDWNDYDFQNKNIFVLSFSFLLNVILMSFILCIAVSSAIKFLKGDLYIVFMALKWFLLVLTIASDI